VTPDVANQAISVLVIDDQSHVRHWIRGVLGGVGISQVTEATDGRDALSKVTEPGAHFDLILCDLGMPGRDGIETIRALASLSIDASIAILSMEEERLIEMAAVLAESQGLKLVGALSKPLTGEKLDAVLATMRLARAPDAPQSVIAPEYDLAAAFVKRELRLMYQPKVEVATKRFAGVEALVRWKHPQLGMFQPSAFVPLIEGSDDYSALLIDYSLDEAIACVGRWLARGRELRVAVNLAARAFDKLDLPERVEAIARKYRVPPEMITIEVTETQVARDAIRMLDVATRLRLKRFRLSVDDFGTGHSGLQQLQELPFNEMKIDRRFVDGCSGSAVKRSVVEASLALAKSLKLVSVAEGVQAREDWEMLEALGCDVVQGYYIARPMTEDGLETWTEQWAAREG
jgi:EAL domain-containing protein (putative c-di-GMP-specific phosphodiesterase class I)/ActR/RegA family two-component response regulator